LLFRFTQIDLPGGVRVQISAERQTSAKQLRLAKQMANRQLVVPSITNKQQPQQVTFTNFLVLPFCNEVHSTDLIVTFIGFIVYVEIAF